MDTDSTLQEYEIQLEQVEIALKLAPNNEELLKLKADLIEIINLTKELIDTETDENVSLAARNSKNAKATLNLNHSITWKTGERCMAIWRVDAKYYPAVVDQVLDDGTCTVIFDGYKNTEITQVDQLMPFNNNGLFNTKDFYTNKTTSSGTSQVGHKKAFTKKELELKLKEAKKRKKEKFAQKIKAMEEISEKEKNKWKSFNNKLSAKTWKGVVKKNKFETPDDHESKIGVGTNSLSNRLVSATGTILLPPAANSASAAASASLVSKLSKSSAQHSYK